MYQHLRDFFEEKDADRREWHSTKMIQKGQGRLEIREIWTSTEMNECFERAWAGMAQVFRLRRYVKAGEKEHEEIVYGVTNLSRRQANASRLLALQQARLSDRKSAAFSSGGHLEGRCPAWVRITGAPEALAALNGGVLALMDWLQVSTMASQRRHFCAHPVIALQVLCGKLLREYG